MSPGPYAEELRLPIDHEVAGISQVVVIRSHKRLGYVSARNEAAKVVNAPVCYIINNTDYLHVLVFLHVQVHKSLVRGDDESSAYTAIFPIRCTFWISRC